VVRVEATGSSANVEDTHVACEDVKPSRRFVVNSGNERYRISESVEAIGLKDLAAELAAL
jgi:hypothetical protein